MFRSPHFRPEPREPSVVGAGELESEPQGRVETFGAVSTSQSRGTWPSGIHLALAMGMLLFHTLFGDPYYTFVSRLCSGISAAVCVLALTRYMVVNPPRLPWIEFVLVVHYAQFGMPVTVEPVPVGITDHIPTPEAHEAASLLASCSLLFLLAGFLLPIPILRRFRPGSWLPTITPQLLSAGSRIYFFVAAFYVLLISITPIVRLSFFSVVNILDGLFHIAPMVVVTAAAYLSRPTKGTIFIFLASLCALAVSVSVTSMLGTAIVPLCGLATLWWRARGKLPWTALVSALALAIVLQPVKGHYRDLRWYGTSNLSVVDAWGEAFLRAGSSTSEESGSSAVRKRMSELGTLAYVYEVVPKGIPHTEGEAFKTLAIAAVPRLFWPDKPDLTKIGLDRYTILLGLMTEEGTRVSTMGMSLCSHGWIEYGLIGSLGWMFALGLAIAVLVHYFGMSLAGVIGGTAMMVGWIGGLGAGILACFGGLWQTVFASTLLVWILKFLGNLHTLSTAPSTQPRVTLGNRTDPVG